jgi:hypothetical protein
LNTLRAIADALNARVRVLIEPLEDVLKEYDSDATDATTDGRSAERDIETTSNAFQDWFRTAVRISEFQTISWPWDPVGHNSLAGINRLAQSSVSVSPTNAETKLLSQENDRLRAENERLKEALLINQPKAARPNEAVLTLAPQSRPVTRINSQDLVVLFQ